MKRKLKMLALAVVLAVTAAVLFLVLYPGPALRKAIETGGAEIFGVPVKVAALEVDLMGGKIRAGRLHIGNPEGFQTPGFLDFASADISLDMWSLLKGTVVVHRVVVREPVLTFEGNFESSNFNVIRAHIKSTREAGRARAGADKKPSGGLETERMVIVDEFVLQDPRVNVHFASLPPQTLAFATVTARDVGRTENGVTFKEAVRQIVEEITGAAHGTIRQVAGQIKEVGRELKEAFRSLLGRDKNKNGAKPGEK